MKYLMCLDDTYEIKLSNDKNIAISDLESILDSIIYLLKIYMIDDSEIIDTIKNDLGLEIEKKQ